MSGVLKGMTSKTGRNRLSTWKTSLYVFAGLLIAVVVWCFVGSTVPDRPFAGTSLNGLMAKIERKRSLLLDALGTAYDHCPRFEWGGTVIPLPPQTWESVQIEAMRELARRTNDAPQVVGFISKFLDENVREQTRLGVAGFESLLALREQESAMVRQTFLSWFKKPRNVPLEYIIGWMVAADPHHPDVVQAITNELVNCFWTLPHAHPKLSLKPWPGAHIRRELMFHFTRLELSPAEREGILATLADTPAASIANELAAYLVDLPLTDEERLQLLTRLATSPHDAAAAAALGALVSGKADLQPDGWLKPILERELRNPMRSSIVGSSIAKAILERDDVVELFTPSIQAWLTNRTEFASDTVVPVVGGMIRKGMEVTAAQETLKLQASDPEFVSRGEACYAHWLISTDAGSTIAILLNIIEEGEPTERPVAVERLEDVIEGRADRLTMLLDGLDQLEARRKAVAKYFLEPEKREHFRQTLGGLIDTEMESGKKLVLQQVLGKFIEYYDPQTQ